MDKDTRNTLENYKIEPFTLIHDIVVNWWAILLGALAAALADTDAASGICVFGGREAIESSGVAFDSVTELC